MILRLLKRDPAWKIGVGVASLTVVQLLFLSVVPGGPDPHWTRLLFVQASLIIAVFWCPHRRATLFEAALPIEGRQLFLARLLSRLALVWLPVLAGILVIHSAPDTGWPEVLGMLECGILFTLACLLPLSVRVRECAAPAGLLAALSTGLAAAGALAWHFLPPGPFLSVFALAGALILLRTWFAIPASFQVAPMQEVGSIPSPRSTRDARPLAWWPIVRSAGFGMPLFIFPVGVLLGWSGDLSVPFAGIFAIMANIDVRQRTRWLYALPLSFRALALVTVVPSLVLLFGGVAIGMGVGRPPQSDYSLGGGPRRQPPSRYGHKRRTSNSGSARRPARRPSSALRGERPLTPPRSGFWGSRSSIPIRWARGTASASSSGNSNGRHEAVYGRIIPIMQYGPASRAGLVPVTARPRMRILILSADMLAVLMLVYLTEWTRWHRLRRLPVSLRDALPFVSVIGVLAIEGIVMWIYRIPLGTALVHAALLQLSDLLPNNLLVVTIAGAVPAMGMYWLVEKQFSKSELLGPIRPRTAWDRMMKAE